MATAELRARATLDGSQFTSAVGAMGGAMSKFSQLLTVGGIVAGIGLVAKKLWDATCEAAKFGKEITDAAKNLGITAASMMEFNNAASLEGKSTDLIASKLFKLADSQQEALMGNKELQESFKLLGISIGDLASKDVGQLMRMMGENAEKSGGSIKALNDILGGGAAREMLDVFEKMKSGGTTSIVNANDLATLRNMEDGLNKIATRWKEVKTTFSAGIARLFGFGASDEQLQKEEERRKQINKLQQEGIRQARKADLTKQITQEKTKIKEVDLSGIKVAPVTAADAMAKIGAFTGGQANTSKQILERQEQVMKKQLEVAEANREHLKKIAEQTAALEALGE